MRGALLFTAFLWLAVFGIAWILEPYENGEARTMETHLQLGLASCTFKELAQLPCPSCGMTTSFALLVKGDLLNSLRANCAGTILALFGMVFVLWAVTSALRARLAWFRNYEALCFRLAVGFLVLMFLRWGVVVLWIWLSPTPAA